jgi:putative FmdB family regulatory protein
MPVYTYFCDNCKKEYEYDTSYPDYDFYIPTCPHCKTRNVHRVIKFTPVIFKGKGFYSLDNKTEEEE